MLKINLTSIFVDNQEKALKFYTEKAGFIKKHDVPMGEYKWLTVITPGSEEIELLLEPNNNPAAQTFQKSMYESGIPATSFGSDDVKKDYERMLDLGVKFIMEPKSEAWGVYAIFDDTCGNFINIHQVGK